MVGLTRTLAHLSLLYMPSSSSFHCGTPNPSPSFALTYMSGRQDLNIIGRTTAPDDFSLGHPFQSIELNPYRWLGWSSSLILEPRRSEPRASMAHKSGGTIPLCCPQISTGLLRNAAWGLVANRGGTDLPRIHTPLHSESKATYRPGWNHQPVGASPVHSLGIRVGFETHAESFDRVLHTVSLGYDDSKT
jgi:hypothetical protein